MPEPSGGKNKVAHPFEKLSSRLANLLQGSISSVGLDIGASSLKGVKLRRTAGQPTLSASPTVVPLPPQPQANQLRDTLRQILQTIGADAKSRVITAVGGTGTVLRPVVIPKMSPQELKTALTFEAEKYIPFKLEEVFLDSAILAEQPGGRMEVLLAAARKDLVQAHLDLLTWAGVSPQAIALEPVALANAWELSPMNGAGPPPGESSAAPEPVGLIHLGARGTTLIFFSGSRLQFTREITIGGQAFTQSVSEILQMDAAQAEQLKCQPADKAEQVRAALLPSWEEWLGQCRASLDFYENQTGRGVSRLCLSGGSARLTGFQEWIQTSTGLPTQLWNPLLGIQGTPALKGDETAGLSLGVAVGLALAGLGE